MAPRATLLGVLVASAVFSIAVSKSDLRSFIDDINGDVIAKNAGSNQIEMSDMIASENIVIMQLRAYYKQRARNPIFKPRNMMIVYVKSTDDVKDLFVELVNNLIDDSSEYLWKFVLDGRNESQLSSLEEYLKEPKNKVSSVITVQLTKASSESEAMILGEDDANITQTEHFKITSANDNIKYIDTNGIELVIKLEDGKTDLCVDMIKTAKEVKTDVIMFGNCVISSDVTCKGSKGNIASSTTPSGIRYISNGATCSKDCPISQDKKELNCLNGAFSGAWCEDKKCPHGGLKVNNYCFLTTAKPHDIKGSLTPSQCNSEYNGYSNIQWELFNNGVAPALDKECNSNSKLINGYLWTGITDAVQTIGLVVKGKTIRRVAGFKTSFSKGQYILMHCANKWNDPNTKLITIKAVNTGSPNKVLCFKKLY